MDRLQVDELIRSDLVSCNLFEPYFLVHMASLLWCDLIKITVDQIQHRMLLQQTGVRQKPFNIYFSPDFPSPLLGTGFVNERPVD